MRLHGILDRSLLVAVVALATTPHRATYIVEKGCITVEYWGPDAERMTCACREVHPAETP